jgi:hypothetical protein
MQYEEPGEGVKMMKMQIKTIGQNFRAGHPAFYLGGGHGEGNRNLAGQGI